MEKGLLIEGIAKNVLVMLPKAKAIFKDTNGTRFPEQRIKPFPAPTLVI